MLLGLQVPQVEVERVLGREDLLLGGNGPVRLVEKYVCRAQSRVAPLCGFLGAWIIGFLVLL